MRKLVIMMMSAVVGVALLCACSPAAEPSSTPSPASAPATTTTPVAPDSEDALRIRALDFYEVLAEHRWGEVFDYYTPRCQAMTTRAELADYAESQYGAGSGRAIEGDADVMISMDGRSARVVTKAADGGDLSPIRWAFVDGQWRNDHCG